MYVISSSVFHNTAGIPAINPLNVFYLSTHPLYESFICWILNVLSLAYSLCIPFWTSDPTPNLLQVYSTSIITLKFCYFYTLLCSNHNPLEHIQSHYHSSDLLFNLCTFTLLLYNHHNLT